MSGKVDLPKIPLEMVHHCSREFVFDLTNSDGTASYTPASGDTFHLAVRASESATEYLINKTVTVPEDGQVILKMTPDDTLLVDPGVYVYGAVVRIGTDCWAVVKVSDFTVWPNMVG